MKRIVLLWLFVAGAMSAWAQNEPKPTVLNPIGCLTTYIPADQDPKPEFKNTGNAEMDKYMYEKHYNAWQSREEMRNPKLAPVAQLVEQSTTLLAQTTITAPEKQRINPIQYILDKGITTVAQLQSIAPNMPLPTNTTQTNDQIIQYMEVGLTQWVANYPRETEAFYNKIISPEKLQQIPQFKE